MSGQYTPYSQLTLPFTGPQYALLEDNALRTYHNSTLIEKRLILIKLLAYSLSYKLSFEIL